MKRTICMPPPLSDKDILSFLNLVPVKLLINKGYLGGYTETATLWAENVVKAGLRPFLVGWPDGISSFLEYEYLLNDSPYMGIPEPFLIEVYHNAYKVVQQGQYTPKATIKFEVGSFSGGLCS